MFRIQQFLLAIAACCLTGCQTGKPLAAINLAEPGWRSLQGQAVWRPNRTSPEIAGDLLIEIHPDGRSLAQFSKTPFTIVVAQSASNRWSLQFPPQHLSFTGRGRGPSRVIWLQVGPIVRGMPPPNPWILNKRDDADWRADNSKTGESLEVFLNP